MKPIKLTEEIISNPDIFNYNFRVLRDEINLLLLKSVQLQELAKKHIIIYDQDYIEQLRYKIKNLQGKLDALKRLNSSSKYSNILKYDFDSTSERLESSSYYVDPKIGVYYPREAMLRVNPVSSSVESTQNDKTNIDIKNIEIVSAISENSDFDNKNGRYNFYLLRYDPASSNIYLDINFDESDINSVSFDPAGESSVDLVEIQYNNNGTMTALNNTSRIGLFYKTEIVFPAVITDKIRLVFNLTRCKTTNRYPSNDPGVLLRDLLLDYQMYLEMEDYDPQNANNYFYFIFYFGIEDISISYNSYIQDGMFVSRPSKSIEPSQFSLSVDEKSNEMSIEYYLRIEHLSRNGTLLSYDVVPILPDEKEDVVDEVVVFDNSKALTCFFVDTDETYTLKENGSIINDFTISEEEITYGSVDPTAIYTFSYTPYHRSHGTATSVYSPTSTITKTYEFEYSPSIHIKGSINDGVVIEDNQGPIDFLKFILDDSIDDTSIAIQRFINSSSDPDIEAPIFDYEGAGQNVFVNGRIVYIVIDPASYPKLFNSSYEITAEMYQNSFGVNDLYLYSNDNSIIINWDAFAADVYAEYGSTNIYLIIIARSSSSTPGNIQVENAYLSSNKFTDFQFSRL